MMEDANIIEINDHDTIKQHIEYLSEIRQHCKIVTQSGKEINGIFTKVEDNQYIAVESLEREAIEINKDEHLSINYFFEETLHSFSTYYLIQKNGLIYFQVPDLIKRYQMRRYKRVIVPQDKNVKIQFNLISNQNIETLVKDVGEGGIALFLNNPPEKLKKNIRLNSIKLLLKENKTLHVSGILRYIRKLKVDSEETYRMGIEFDPLKDDDRSTLLDFMDNLEKS